MISMATKRYCCYWIEKPSKILLNPLLIRSLGAFVEIISSLATLHEGQMERVLALLYTPIMILVINTLGSAAVGWQS